VSLGKVELPHLTSLRAKLCLPCKPQRAARDARNGADLTLARQMHSQPPGDGRCYMFPSPHTYAKPMSENAITAALRRMGYTGQEMTWHGFRSLASTYLNEQGWHPDLIELQLAHAERNKVRAAYNRAQRLADRRTMMQAWADYLDGLRIAKNDTRVTGEARVSAHSVERNQWPAISAAGDPSLQDSTAPLSAMRRASQA
jgi:Phage integrase family